MHHGAFLDLQTFEQCFAGWSSQVNAGLTAVQSMKKKEQPAKSKSKGKVCMTAARTVVYSFQHCIGPLICRRGILTPFATMPS